MAVYEEPARRRRTIGAIALVGLVVGLVVGTAIGRGTATSIDEQIGAGRDGGRELVASERVLALEYRQAFAGSSETGLIEDTVDRSAAQLPGALGDAPWLSAAQRRAATGAVRAVQEAVRQKVTPDRFETVLDASTATLESVFGLPASGGA